MGVKDSKLWEILKEKAKGQPNESQFIAEMEKVCNFAVARSKYINLTFPMFTLHDETHICNVLNLMVQLLGDRIQDLNRDEAAMLILAACCHDIGMSCNDIEKQDLLKDDRFKQYLDKHHGEQVNYHELKEDDKDYTKKLDAIFRGFLRYIHHERIKDLLPPANKKLNENIWNSALGEKMRKDLIDVCMSHGESCEKIEKMPGPKHDEQADLRMCAVLLRLADILDFDTSRAPRAIYDYCGFNDVEETDNNEKNTEKGISKTHWDNHMASRGFRFKDASKRGNYYELYYNAECETMQIHQSVNSYLDWVDQELKDCGTLLKKFAGKWNNLVLPWKVDRDITPIGYLPGEYRFTLDQSQVLNLLGGEELYSDPAAFVRELLQNAIDAVRTRKAFDRNLSQDWTGQINIRTWTDNDGDWFRIEDNGTGMTKEIIENHLLKVGSSYYNSDEFKNEKRLNCVDDYTPISRFGIGILSCFMGDKEHSRVEISTKRYGENYPPALRLRMDGLSGYYAMYSSEKDDNHPGEMPGCSNDEKQEYLTAPGSVVAVRTNLYRTGKYHGFKEIVDKWLVFPPVPVHYEGPDWPDGYDYPTQEEFMKTVHDFAYSDDLTKDGVMEIPLSKSQLDEIRETFTGIKISDSTKVVLKCADLERYSQTPNITGAILAFKIEPEIPNFFIDFLHLEEIHVNIKAKLDYKNSAIELYLDTSFASIDSRNRYMYLGTEDWDMYKKLRSFEQQYLTIHILLQKEKIPWYKHFQQTIQNLTNSVTVHNGIFCGDADFFCENNNYDPFVILLIRDDCRPKINLARNNIEHLSPELLFMCDLIRNQLANECFSIFYDTKFSELYRFSPSDMYLSMLENRPHYKESVERTCKLLYKRVQITDKKMMNLYPQRYPFSNNFTMAYLQANYALYLNNDLSKIILKEGKPNNLNVGWKLFPPAFFLPASDENCTYFTQSFRWNRLGCNSCHPLSKFLLSKAKEIKIKSPGCFNKIVFAITDEEDGDKLISVLNDQLKILQSIPGNPLGVTDDLLLKESDLIYPRNDS